MKTKPIPEHPAALYFNELAPGPGERCALFGHFYHLPEPDALLTRPVVATANNGWGVISKTDINEIICGGAYLGTEETRRLVAVYRNGETYIYYPGQKQDTIARPPGAGFLWGVCQIDEVVYTCGSQNGVYRLEKDWVDISSSIRVKYGGPSDPILTAIAGFSAKDIYAVGYNGSIFHYDGSTWSPVASPTERHLHQVVCHQDGKVYVCGTNGTLLRGGVHGWENLEVANHKDDFWGLTSFDGTVYACTFDRLFRLQNGQFNEVKVAENTAGSFYRLASNQGYMWATTGTGRVLRFDKTSWIEMTWPDSF